MDRPIKQIYPDGTFEKSIYDKLDVILSCDRAGKWSQSAFDNMDRLVYSIDPAGKKTQYGWCTCGALSSLTDPKNQTTTWEYDLRNRLIQKTYADNTKVLYAYDPNSGLLDSRTDAKNQIRLYFDFSDGNQSMISYHNAEHPTQSVASTIDYNFKRILTSQKSDWGKYTFTFNSYMVNGSTTETCQ